MRAFIATANKRRLVSPVWILFFRSYLLAELPSRSQFSFCSSHSPCDTCASLLSGFLRSTSEQLLLRSTSERLLRSNSERISHPRLTSWAYLTLMTQSVLCHPRSPSWAYLTLMTQSVLCHPRSLSWAYPKEALFVYGAILLFSTSRSHVCDSHESGSCYCALV